MPNLVSQNPANGQTIATYSETTAPEVMSAVEAAHAAHVEWRRRPCSDRAEIIGRAGTVLRSRIADLSRLMTDEMGKPIDQSRAEIEKCAWVCEYYSESGPAFLEEVAVETDATRSYVSFEPLGVVLAVMPWNFPFWQVFRFAAPALLAGNAGLLKHASNVTGCSLAIEDVLRSAGAPAGLFRSLVLPAARVHELIEHPLIRGVTLTGSAAAGRAVAERAGRCIKKTVLELGGSDPYVVLEDADVDMAAATCASSRLINGGQSCIAAKRFVVVDGVRDTFERSLVDRMAATVMGDPLDPEVELGPMARTELRDELHEQVAASVAAGARLLLGGEIPDVSGAYYPPTVLTDVQAGMPAYDEEVFGPVAAIIPVEDEEEAVAVANDSPFGLGAAVFTSDIERGERIAAKELMAGSCFVNAFVRSDPRLPFGGIKDSGFGRELSDFGIREFVNVKTVYVA